MVLIWGDSTLKTSYRWPCFRPLTGIMVLIVVDVAEDLKYDIIEFPSPYGDYGSYLRQGITGFMMARSGFRPLTGIMVLIYDNDKRTSNHYLVSVPLRGLWFLSAPLINGFIAPSKMPFAGRIFFSSHFSHFCRKWFSKIFLSLIFKPAGRNDSFYVFKKQVGRINTVWPN